MEKDGEMLRLGQVIEIIKSLLACTDLSDEEEWERIRKYVYARFKVDMP